jgi:hypothetical protein
MALAVAALAAACGTSEKPSPQLSQQPPRVDRSDQVRRGVADAATMPLRDVGLIKPDIPAPLTGLEYPYESQRLLSGCSQILYELGQLDAALGPETYQPAEQRRLMQRGADAAVGGAVGVARDAAGDVIPFRGWVRRASGAAKAEKDVAHAIEMGQMRRAFLRGYGAAIGCANAVPAPPPEPTPAPARPQR